MRGRVYIFSAFEKGLSTVLLSFGSLLVAYLIGPEDYGKFGLLFGAYLFSSLINDSGTATSILNFSLEYTSQRAAHIGKLNNKNNIISVVLFVLITSYYVIINFSSSWLISVFVLVISLRIHSKTIIPHSILIKQNRYMELNQITIISSIGALLLTLLLSRWIADFSLGSLFVLSLALLKYILVARIEDSVFDFTNTNIYNQTEELREYSLGIFKISLTNQAFLIVLDLILSMTINFELLGKYKLDLFLINTLVLTFGSSFERIWISNYDTYSDIPKHFKIKLLGLLYFLLCLSIPFHYVTSAFFNYLGKSEILLSTDNFSSLFLCYITVPLQQLLLIRAKKMKLFLKPYTSILILIRLITLMFIFVFMLLLILSFTSFLYIYATASFVLYIVPLLFVKYGLSDE